MGRSALKLTFGTGCARCSRADLRLRPQGSRGHGPHLTGHRRGGPARHLDRNHPDGPSCERCRHPRVATASRLSTLEAPTAPAIPSHRC